MAKEDVVAAQLVAIQAAETQAISAGLGACYDQGALDQKASDGTLSQGDLDAAVAAAVAPLNDQISALTAQDASDKQALVDAQASAASAIADMQSKLDAAIAADVGDKKLVSDLQGAVAAVQTALDNIKAALTPPAPVPVPVPVPDPVPAPVPAPDQPSV